MTAKVLSVITPVRNQPGTLELLLRALDEQICPDGWELEVIVVDNNSTDNTPDVIKSHRATYILEERLGPSIARNTGAAAATGELFWFIDADAYPIGKDFVVKLIRAAEELGDFGGFGGPILLPESQRNNPVAFADHMSCWSAWSAWRPQEHSGFQPTSTIIRRELFEQVGGFDTSLRVLEDWELQLRLEQSRREEEGPEAPLRPVWFVPDLGVAHHARSSLLRTIKHSWYWGLPSREGWLKRSGIPVGHMERPVLRWLALPRLLAGRAAHPLRTAWRESRWRTIFALPFMFITLLVWSVAVIVGDGQPEDSHEAPV